MLSLRKKNKTTTNKPDSRWTSRAASSPPSALHIRGINAGENGHTDSPQNVVGKGKNYGKKNVPSKMTLGRVVPPPQPLRCSSSSAQQLCFIVGVRKRWLCVNPSSCPGALARSPWLPPQEGAGPKLSRPTSGPGFKIKARKCNK